MGKIVTVDFRSAAEKQKAREIEKEQQLVDQLRDIVEKLKARAAGPDCPPGIGWRAGK